MTTSRLQALQAAPDVVGDYEVLLPIGTGGMGNVYLARKKIVGDVHRAFALKLIRPQLDADADWSRLLIEEAKIAARMRHPNVVSVLEVAESAYGVYLVMDYVEGVNLAALVRASAEQHRTLPLRVIARVLHDALAGLHAVHELRDASGAPLNVVHRDVSPQNLLVGADGTTRLTDFGIAKASSRPDTTATGAIKGKLRYMSPEQARGKTLDRRADLWAMGVIAWEAIAGRRLFEGESDGDVLLRITAAADFAPLCEQRHDVSVEIDEAVKHALTADPRARCSTALELQKRLDAAWPDGIAPAREVAAYVEEMAGRQLSEYRRAQRSLRPEAQSGSAAAVTAEPRLGDRTAPPEETGSANVVDATRDVRARKSSRGRWAVAALAIAAGAAGVLWRADLRLRSSERARSGLAAAARSLVPFALVPTASAPPEAALALPAGVLEVGADVLFRQISIDGKPLLLGQPSRSVTVQRPSGEAASLRIEIVSVDGRRAEKTISGDAGAVTFELGAPPPRAPRPPSDRRLLPYRPSEKDSR